MHKFMDRIDYRYVKAKDQKQGRTGNSRKHHGGNGNHCCKKQVKPKAYSQMLKIYRDPVSI